MANLRGQTGGTAQVAFAVRAVKGEALEAAEAISVDVYDIIGDPWGDGVSARDVLGQLRAAKSAKTINVRINSMGGFVDEALAIYNLLHQNQRRVIVDIDGIAASAATIVAMAGDEIRMAENALMMVHNPWTIAAGDAAEMRSKAAELDKTKDALLATYAARTGRSRDELSKMLDDETWMTAEEAFALGFATAITPAKQIAAMLKSDVDLAAAQQAIAERAARGNRPPTTVTSTHTEPHHTTGGALVMIPRFAVVHEFIPGNPQPSPPPVAAATPQPSEANPMSNSIHPSIAQALGLPVGAPESDCIAACARLRELEVQVVALTGCASSSEAAGAVRGLKAAADESKKLREENAQLRGERDKQNFDTQLQRGLNERKLSPKTADLYREKFERMSADGRGAEVVADLKGFIDVAPTLHQEPLRQPAPGATGNASTPLAWNGKSYAEMKPLERARLSQSNPELYHLMKADFDASDAA